MPPDEPTDEERTEELPEDNGTTFRPADDAAAGSNDLPTVPQQLPLDDTHPATDTGLQPEEVYEKGLSGAAGVEDPEAGQPPQAHPLEPEDSDEE